MLQIQTDEAIPLQSFPWRELQTSLAIMVYGFNPQSQRLLPFVQMLPDCGMSFLLLVYEIQNYMLIK